MAIETVQWSIVTFNTNDSSIFETAYITRATTMPAGFFTEANLVSPDPTGSPTGYSFLLNKIDKHQTLNIVRFYIMQRGLCSFHCIDTWSFSLLF